MSAETGLTAFLKEFNNITAYITVLDHHPSGSCIINGEGADFDVVMLVPDMHKARSSLISGGWGCCNDEAYESETFLAMRKGIFNLILIDDQDYYEGWERALNVCRYVQQHIGTLKKVDRAAIFDMIRIDVEEV